MKSRSRQQHLTHNNKKEHITTVPYIDNTGFYFYPSNDTWHGLESINIKDLKKEWANYPVRSYAQTIGDEWIKGIKSLVFEVPSSVNSLETNYLINPLHPLFPKITIKEIVPWNFDPRLINK